MVLNEQHTVVPDLDIYQKVGRGTAHDEYVTFTVSKSKIKVQGEVSTLSGYLRVEFQKVNDFPVLCHASFFRVIDTYSLLCMT